MDKASIVKLAKLLNNFTELESSYVMTEDIKAIRKVLKPVPSDTSEGKFQEGMEVVTPYGTFWDSMHFDTFRTRVGDVLEALKEQEPEPVHPPRVIPLDQPVGGVPGVLPPVSSPPPPPPGLTNPPQSRRTTVEGFGKNGANGRLYPEEAGLRVVNRETLEIQSPDGTLLAQGTKGGTIVGESISGIIYENGKYTLADKGCGGKVIILYHVEKR